MMWRSDTGGRHGETPGVRLGVSDELRAGLGRDRWMNHQKEWIARDPGDRGHLMEEVEAGLFVERGIDCIGGCREQERVAVRRGAYHELGGEIASRARSVF